MNDFLTESASLRACNLPATQNWREWLRGKLPSQEISTGRIYSRALVDELAAKIRPINADIVLPPETAEEPVRTAPEPPIMHTSGPIDAGVKPRRKRELQLTNRLAPELETR